MVNAASWSLADWPIVTAGEVMMSAAVELRGISLSVDSVWDAQARSPN